MADQITNYSGSNPSRSQAQATFDTNVDDWLAWFTDTVIGEINALATSVEGDATNAEAAKDAAEAASSLTNFQGTYAGGTTYALADSVVYNDVFYQSLQASNTGNTPDSSPSYWQQIAVTGLNLLSTVTASAASTADIETTFDSTYDEYLITFTDITTSADADILVRAKISGSYHTSANYDYHSHESNGGASTYVAVNGAAATSITMLSQADLSLSNAGFDAKLHLSKPSATKYPRFHWAGVAHNGSIVYVHNGAGVVESAGAVTGVRIYPSTGTLSGTFRLYGIRK